MKNILIGIVICLMCVACEANFGKPVKVVKIDNTKTPSGLCEVTFQTVENGMVLRTNLLMNCEGVDVGGIYTVKFVPYVGE